MVRGKDGPGERVIFVSSFLHKSRGACLRKQLGKHGTRYWMRGWASTLGCARVGRVERGREAERRRRRPNSIQAFEKS